MCKVGQSLLIDRGKGNFGKVLREQHLAEIFRYKKTTILKKAILDKKGKGTTVYRDIILKELHWGISC